MECIGRIGNVRCSILGARLVAGVVGLACILAACTSEAAGPAPEPPVTGAPSSETVEAAETTTTSTSSTSTTTTTTDPPPVVNSVEPGSSEPTTDTTVAPEPLPVPTNTMYDPTTPSGEVEQAVLADLAAFVTCLEQLPDCDVDAASRHSALENAEATVDLASGWNAAGYEARATDDYNYRVEGILEFSEDGLEAVAQLCVWGGTQLYLPATDSAPEAIIDGDYGSSRQRVLVRRLGETWFVAAQETDQETTGEANNLCV